MPRRAGKQKGHLREKPPSWVGEWKEYAFDPKQKRNRWMTRSCVISPLKRMGDKGRLVNIPEEDARKIFEETILSKLPQHSSNPTAMGTVKEFWNQKFKPALIAEGAQPKTIEDWLGVWKKVEAAFGNKQIRHVTPADLDKLIMAAQLKQHRRTAQLLYTRMGTFFRRAKQMGWYSGDLPTELMRQPKYESVEAKSLTREQVVMLVHGDPKRKIAGLPSPAREVVSLGIMTGMRIGELVGLKWKCVNLTGEAGLCDGEPTAPRSIAVREQFQRVFGKYLEDAPRGRYKSLKTGKGGKRDIPLAGPAVAILERVKATSKHTKPDCPVFAIQSNGKPILAKEMMRRVIRRALANLGLPAVGWHCMRHTQTTLADEAGMPAGQRQRILGHSNQQMTARYTHADLERTREWVEAMAAPFAGMAEQPEPIEKVVAIRKSA